MNSTTGETAVKPFIEVPLGSRKCPGNVALIDAEDYGLVRQYTWSLSKKKTDKTSYATTHTLNEDGRPTTMFLHRLILGLTPRDSHYGEHINGNGLDNRRSNLRRATNQQNQANASPRGGTSQYKGVYWNKRIGKWHARVKVNGRIKHIGYFDDEVEAAKAYNKVAVKYYGEFSRPNIV